MTQQRRIFILHGSPNLTDHSFHGDGLIAWGFIKELARRGHRINVATEKLDVKGDIPPNLTLREFPRGRRNAAFHYASYMLRVKDFYDRVAAAEGVDVIHQMNPVVRGLSLAVMGKRVPVVLGSYDGDWVRLRTDPYWARPRLRERARNFGKAFLDVVQQQMASSIILSTPHALKRVPLNLGCAGKIDFLEHGVDIDFFHPDALASDPPPIESSILFVGSIQHNKGSGTLADAFARVVSRVPAARLVMVGQGRFLQTMKERLAALGVLDRVHFAGRATRAEVAGWLRACDLLCAPSFGEPYGQNVVEAMAAGKPVVISSVGGHRYIGDRFGTRKVDPGNVEQLAEALSSLLLQPQLLREMGRHNRKVAEERHAWSRVTDSLEQIYERAISSQSVS